MENFYHLLDLDKSWPSAKLSQRLRQLNRQYRQRVNHKDPQVVHEATEKLNLINRAMVSLGNEPERLAYLAQLAQHEAHLQELEVIKNRPVALRYPGREIIQLADLADGIEQDPPQLLNLLLNGEIEAWLRWSLGENEQADWVRSLAQFSRQQSDPYGGLWQLWQYARPEKTPVLVGWQTQQKQLTRVDLTHLATIPALADQFHWLFVAQLPALEEWLAGFPAGQAILTHYQRFAPAADPAIQLERLLFCIDPGRVVPQVRCKGLNKEGQMEVKNLTQEQTFSFQLLQQGRGFLYGQLATNTTWLQVTPTWFSGPETAVLFTLRPELFPAAGVYVGHIMVYLNDNRRPPLTIPVQVHVPNVLRKMRQLLNGLFE